MFEDPGFKIEHLLQLPGDHLPLPPPCDDMCTLTRLHTTTHAHALTHTLRAVNGSTEGDIGKEIRAVADDASMAALATFLGELPAAYEAYQAGLRAREENPDTSMEEDLCAICYAAQNSAVFLPCKVWSVAPAAILLFLPPPPPFPPLPITLILSIPSKARLLAWVLLFLPELPNPCLPHVVCTAFRHSAPVPPLSSCSPVERASSHPTCASIHPACAAPVLPAVHHAAHAQQQGLLLLQCRRGERH